MAAEEKFIKNDVKEKSVKSPPPQKCDSYEQAAPPDGGWGWVVVLASFMIHVVTDGVVYSFGELYKEILEKFKEGAAKTSMIPSILVGTTLCSGPIASALVNKFGCRPVTIAGSLVSTVCILSSIWATTVEMLMLTLGLGTGIGFGLIYLPAIVSVTCYFEKYRSIATGIGVCGSGFGTVIFAPIIKMSITNFHLDGTFVIIACAVLTCVFYGILLRPVPTTTAYEPDTKSVTIYSPDNVPLTTVTLVDEVPTIDQYHSQANGNIRRYSLHDVSYLTVENKDPTAQFVSQPTLALDNPRLNKSSLSLRSHHSCGIMHRKDVFFTRSIRSIKDISKSNGYLPAQQTPLMYHKNTTTTKKKKGCLPCSIDCQETIGEMTDLSLLKDIIFLLFIISNFLTSLGFNLPYIYIPNHVEEKKFEGIWSSYILATVGIGNTAGRIILGYISDNPSANRLFIYNTCLTLCGFACLVNILCTSVLQYVIFAFVFGFTTGAYVGLTSVITVDLFGLDKLTNAFGMLLLFQGIASFLGSPIAGCLCDFFKTFDASYYMAGITIGISGSMLYFVPAIQRHLQKRKTVAANK